MSQVNNPWRILGVDPDVDQETLKRTYRNLVKKYHPDNYQDETARELAEEKMAEINRAYDDITSGRAEKDYASPYGNKGGGSSASGTPFEEWFRQQARYQQTSGQYQQADPQQQSPYYRDSCGGMCSPDMLALLCCLNSCCNCCGR